MNDDLADRVTGVIVDAILEAGGTINFKVQPFARAAIEAMREPSKEMVDAGSGLLVHLVHAGHGIKDNESVCVGRVSQYYHDGSDLSDLWRTMVDAALKYSKQNC